MHQRLLPKPQPPPKPGGQALRTQCKKELDRGPLTTPKPPLAVYCTSETTTPSETRGLTISDTANIILQALRTQCREELGRGPLTTLKPLIVPPLAPPTPAKNGSPSETAIRSDMGGGGGGAVAATAQRLRLCNHAVFTPFLPYFYPTFTPLRVECRVFIPFLPCFYPVAPNNFYPSG